MTRTGPPTIGIVTGSGPEAGIDLWQKVLAATRRQMGERYRGDIDAPRVVIVSEPALGASMDLPATDAEVGAALEATAADVAARCDVYAIACNTLNVYADRLRDRAGPADLVTFPDVLLDWAEANSIRRLGLLGARPVTALGEWSPYTALADQVELVTPADPDPLHRLIEAIKRDGGIDPGHHGALAAIVEGLGVATVALACTELPLVARPVPGTELVDVTELVATALVSRVVAT